MSDKPALPPGSRVWPCLGTLILLAVCGYYGFGALNRTGLPARQGFATVLDKAYYPPGTSYQTLNIGGRAFIRPYQTAEAYVLKLRLNGQETAGLVPKDFYETVATNTEVNVTYEVTRFTRKLLVVEVRPASAKGQN